MSDAKTRLTPLGHAFAGAIGGVLSNAIVYPLDTVKTKMQADTLAAAKLEHDQDQTVLPEQSVKREGAPSRLPAPKRPGVREIANRILKEQGLPGFYRGFTASMLGSFAMQFAYFYWASVVHAVYRQHVYPRLYKVAAAPKSLGTVMELTLGAVAGAIAQLFTIPISVVATRQQLEVDHKGQTLLETVVDVIRDDGITGLWRGLKPSLVLTVNPAITYGMFERIRVWILGEDSEMTPTRAFYIGALSKTLATVVTFPYIMAKVRLQAKYPEGGREEEIEEANEEEYADKTNVLHINRPDKTKKQKYTGAIDVLTKVYQEKGIAGWYQGMQTQIIKAVLAQALLFGLKDALEGYTIRLLAFIAFMRSRKVA